MTRGQAILETLIAFPLLLLAAATAAQLALVAVAGILTRHAASAAARAAAVTGGSTTEARRVAADVCRPAGAEAEVRRLEPSPEAFADFGDRFAFDSADPTRGPRTRLTRAGAARVVIEVTCRLPLRVPVAGPLLARALRVGADRRLALSARGVHRLQSDPVRTEPPGPAAGRP